MFDTVHEHLGIAIGNALSLDKAMEDYITHVIIILVTMFILLQILSIFSARATSGYQASKTTGGSSGQTRKRMPKKYLLLCGATHSGKTALFYHLLTKEVRTTVSSTEINETSGQMEVKIPASAIAH